MNFDSMDQIKVSNLVGLDLVKTSNWVTVLCFGFMYLNQSLADLKVKKCLIFSGENLRNPVIVSSWYGTLVRFFFIQNNCLHLVLFCTLYFFKKKIYMDVCI